MCVSFSLLFTVHFHAYQIKNWPKGGLAAFWRAAYLGSDALTRERDGQQRQWLGARAAQKNKKNLDQLREEEKKSRTFIH
jgi:hypothetical protein